MTGSINTSGNPHTKQASTTQTNNTTGKSTPPSNLNGLTTTKNTISIEISKNNLESEQFRLDIKSVIQNELEQAIRELQDNTSITPGEQKKSGATKVVQYLSEAALKKILDSVVMPGAGTVASILVKNIKKKVQSQKNKHSFQQASGQKLKQANVKEAAQTILARLNKGNTDILNRIANNLNDGDLRLPKVITAEILGAALTSKTDDNQLNDKIEGILTKQLKNAIGEKYKKDKGVRLTKDQKQNLPGTLEELMTKYEGNMSNLFSEST